MNQLSKWDKLYLDSAQTKESVVNTYLKCRDGIVEAYEYTNESGYGQPTRLFLCRDTKHESVALVRQTKSIINKEWLEEALVFDSDSFGFLEALVKGDYTKGNYTLVRSYVLGVVISRNE